MLKADPKTNGSQHLIVGTEEDLRGCEALGQMVYK